MIIFIRSLAFNIFFYSWTAAIALAGLPLLPSRRATYAVAWLWTAVTMHMLQLVCGIKYVIKGREHIVSTPAIYASKHQSAWETLIFYLLLGKPIYVLKRELMLIPIIGFYFWRIGCIAVDRSKGTSAMRHMMVQAKKIAGQGASIVIYPEGTRTAPGAVTKYHPGVVAIYSHLDIPVVPVALNSGYCWGRKAFVKKPGVITLEFLPPIPPGEDKKLLMGKIESSIENACRVMGDATQLRG